MKKIYLALAFLITGFLVAGDAYGEGEIYYCSEIDSNGFDYDEKRGSYKRSGFHATKFKMNLNRATNQIELAPENSEKELYNCITPFPQYPDRFSCVEIFYQFNFNAKNGSFVLSKGYGYISSLEGAPYDTISVSYGKCDKL